MKVSVDIVGNVDEKEISKLRNCIDDVITKYYSTYKIKWEVIKGNEE